MTGENRAGLTRRTLVLGGASIVALAGATVLGIDENLLPGRSTMFRALGLDGPPGILPDVATGPMLTGSFESLKRLGKEVSWAVSYPLGTKPGDHLPVLIALHGFGGSHRSAFGSRMGLQLFLTQAVRNGSRPFAIASVDGGNSYWHKRSSGEDSGAMVTDEFITVLANRGLDTSRVALLGWSMGGFGALYLASKLGQDKAAAVVAESPAIWFNSGQAAHGAFDSPADFNACTPLGKQEQLDGIAVRVDCGIGDGFYPVASSYVDGFQRRPAGGFVPGGHNLNYWRRMAPAQLAFVGAQFG